MAESGEILNHPSTDQTLVDETDDQIVTVSHPPFQSESLQQQANISNDENVPNKSSLDDQQKEIRRLQFELDEARSLVAVANYSLEESLETERRKCQEEVATLQQLMKENIQEAVRQTTERSEGEIRRLKNIVTRLELEVHELRSNADKDNPNVFSAVTKTLARKVNNLTNTSLSISPTMASGTGSAAPNNVADTSSDDYLEQSMKRAQEDVEVLRSLVLPLEEEIKALKDKLRSTDDQLRVYETTQAELVQGTKLISKFIEESQSIENIISDLSARIAENQIPDDVDNQPSSSDHLSMFMAIVNVQRTVLQEEKERLRSQLQEACQLLEAERRQHRELRRASQKTSDQESTSAKDDKLLGRGMKDRTGALFSRISPVLKRKSTGQSPSRESTSHALEESSSTEILHEDDTLNSSATSFETSYNSEAGFAGPVQLRVEEFQGPCQSCKSLNEEKANHEKQLAKAREETVRMSDLIKEMEHKWTEVAKDYEKQVDTLFGNIDELQNKLTAVTSAFKQFRGQAQETLRQLHFDRQSVSTELTRLQEENDFLVGKHSLHAEQLQNEMINLPDNLQELQYVCLNLREDLISAKVAKEALEKRWQTEILMLKDQLATEQLSKETLENSLTSEIDYLREQLGLMRSVHTQLDEESSRKGQLELALQQTKEQLAEFQDRASESVSMKAKMDNELQQLRSRVSSLQADLETSEAVQRDFVQLSQQLQVQLEKIRQSEKELRWQYEDDVDNCAECRQIFNVTKRKHHCRHCCQIFCGDCLRKSVVSGPNKRQSRVCNVCYYLLVQDSAPFFSSEPKPSN